jgi:hypothetical protein
LNHSGGEEVNVLEQGVLENLKKTGGLSHLISLGKTAVSSGKCLDARVQGKLTHEYYAGNHMMGGY